jgi:hypothetical protein
VYDAIKMFLEGLQPKEDKINQSSLAIEAKLRQSTHFGTETKLSLNQEFQSLRKSIHHTLNLADDTDFFLTETDTAQGYQNFSSKVRLESENPNNGTMSIFNLNTMGESNLLSQEKLIRGQDRHVPDEVVSDWLTHESLEDSESKSQYSDFLLLRSLVDQVCQNFALGADPGKITHELNAVRNAVQELGKSLYLVNK